MCNDFLRAMLIVTSASQILRVSEATGTASLGRSRKFFNVAMESFRFFSFFLIIHPKRCLLDAGSQATFRHSFQTESGSIFFFKEQVKNLVR